MNIVEIPTNKGANSNKLKIPKIGNLLLYRTLIIMFLLFKLFYN